MPSLPWHRIVMCYRCASFTCILTSSSHRGVVWPHITQNNKFDLIIFLSFDTIFLVINPSTHTLFFLTNSSSPIPLSLYEDAQAGIFWSHWYHNDEISNVEHTKLTWPLRFHGSKTRVKWSWRKNQSDYSDVMKWHRNDIFVFKICKH